MSELGMWNTLWRRWIMAKVHINDIGANRIIIVIIASTHNKFAVCSHRTCVCVCVVVYSGECKVPATTQTTARVWTKRQPTYNCEERHATSRVAVTRRQKTVYFETAKANRHGRWRAKCLRMSHFGVWGAHVRARVTGIIYCRMQFTSQFYLKNFEWHIVRAYLSPTI